MPGAPKIYFNGCSQVENGHLALETDNWIEQSWPWLLAHHLNLSEYRNDAISLGSNNRILRTTIDAILEYHPDIVIIGLTDPSRIELPVANGDRCRINVHHCNTDNGSTSDQYQTNWFKKHHNNWLAFISTLQIVYQLKMLKQVHGFRLYLFNAVSDNYFESWEHLLPDSFNVAHNRQPWRSKEDQQLVQRLLDEIKNLNWLLPWDDNLYTTVTNKKWAADKFGHAALDSQSAVAELLLQGIDK